MIIVVVSFLCFYFCGKGIINANHNHQPHYSAWLTTLGAVVYAHVASLERFKTEVWGES